MKISKTHHVTKKGKVKKNPVKSEYIVFNFTDGVTASPDIYPNKAAAEAFIKQWKKRFEKQGYYFTSKMERIPISKVDIRPIKAEEIGKALSKSNPWGF